MTSTTSRSNKNKEDKSPPGGGTSNAGNASPRGSSEFSGELVSPVDNDIKPNIDTIGKTTGLSSNDLDLDDRVKAIFTTLTEEEQNRLITSFITASGYILQPAPTGVPPTQQGARLTYNNSSYMSNQGPTDQWTPGTMFDGRETPMDSGFSPNIMNFSQRSNFSQHSYHDPNYGYMTTNPTSTSQPAPAGVTYSQRDMMPSSASFPSGPAPTKPSPAPLAFTDTSNTTSGPRNSVPFPSWYKSTNNNNNNTSVSQPTGTPPHSTPQQPYVQPTSASQPLLHNPQTNSWSAPTSTPATTVVSTLSSGVSLRNTPRPNFHAQYDKDRVIIPRQNRGATDKDRAKIRELCVAPLDPKITRGNMMKLLSSDDSYDIAKDAARWQTDLGNIWTHVVQYDFAHITLIPFRFDPNDSTSIDPNGPFINSVLDHEQLSDDHYFDWQSIIRRFGDKQELISDAWFADKLWSSLDSELRDEVKADFDELPDINKGSISLLRLIINRMVQTNQESRRAMEDFIRTFDIQKFSGENVTKACLRIKAVAQSLGPTKLPTDIVHRVLEGFARSSTPAFSNLCYHQESMISSSLVKTALRQDTLYRTLVSVLADLEIKYIELLSGQRWLGVGNNAPPSSHSTFLADSESGTIDNDNEYNEYIALTARAGRNALPFHIWVKDKICRNCNEIGHIQRDCPRPRRSTQRQSHTKHPNISTQRMTKSRHDDATSSSSTTKPGDTYASKVKALISAAQDLATSSAHVTAPSPEDNATHDDPSSSDDHDYSGFFAALGCPKE